MLLAVHKQQHCFHTAMEGGVIITSQRENSITPEVQQVIIKNTCAYIQILVHKHNRLLSSNENNISYYNLLKQPDAWAYRNQNEVKKKSCKWFGRSFTDLFAKTELQPQPGNFS